LTWPSDSADVPQYGGIEEKEVATMMGYYGGWGWMGFAGTLGMLAFLVALIVLVVWAVRGFTGGNR